MTKSFLGIDTSNYTTSAAIYDGTGMFQKKLLLPVAKGEKGLRQSDAVFSHIKQLKEVTQPVLGKCGQIAAIGVSDKPRNSEGSYMPCFLVGVSHAEVLGQALSVPVYKFSHQQGHIAAALFSAGRLDLLEEKFIAFHVSGGTTEAVMVTPDENKMPKAEIIAQSLDLKAGQLIDRIGVKLNLNFPCGPQIEKLALEGGKAIKFKPSMKGADCSLSGVQNKCEKLILQEETPQTVALFVLNAVKLTLEKMAAECLNIYGNLPIVFSGGVCANSLIRKSMEEKFNAIFAAPEFSADNAAGVAVLAERRRRIE